jgi:uncharacterized iron-regulated membrane protein
MTDATVSPATTVSPPAEAIDDDVRPTRLRPLIWRLHFLGGFLAAPIAMWLAMTGLLFAWNPQIESWLFGDEMDASAAGDPLPLSQQVEAATAAYPDDVLVSVEPAVGSGDATAVVLQPADAPPGEFGAGPDAFTAYVDPVSGDVTGRVAESRRPDEWLRNLHSNFRLGTGAGTLTELAASWVMVALLTGLYLWWPKSRHALRRALVPRLSGLRGGGRRPWRNLHSTVGVLVLAVLTVVVATGLTWTEYAGGWVDVTKDALAVEAPFLNTEVAGPTDEDAEAGAGHAQPGHQGGAGAAGAETAAPDVADIDSVATSAEQAGLTGPFTITPAAEAGQAWKVGEIDDRWPLDRTEVAIDPASGEVVDRLEFSDKPLIDQATTLGIGFHEASLFGLANQLLLTVLGLAVIVMLVAGYMTWWRRRPAGAFGAPPRMGPLLRTVPVPLLIGFVVLMVLLPTLGVTFVVYLILERVVRAIRLRRRPALAP